jgi:hypothetical protein
LWRFFIQCTQKVYPPAFHGGVFRRKRATSPSQPPATEADGQGGDDVESGEQWGPTVATPGAVEWLQQAASDAALLLSRHENGDWGDLDEEI